MGDSSSHITNILNLILRLMFDDLTMSHRRREAETALVPVPHTKMQRPCARASRNMPSISSTALRSILLRAFNNSDLYCSKYCMSEYHRSPSSGPPISLNVDTLVALHAKY